jgi:hypothetical protein
MPPAAVFITGDSNLFDDSKSPSVFTRIQEGLAPHVPVFGVYSHYLETSSKLVHDNLGFLENMCCDHALLVICAGQHDVLKGRLNQAVEAVSVLAYVAESHKATVLTIELFDEKSFAHERQDYREGVHLLNKRWEHESWVDQDVNIIHTTIEDNMFLNDRMHLIEAGKAHFARKIMEGIMGKVAP